MNCSAKRVLRATRFVFSLATLVLLSACHVEGRSSRAEILLSQLASGIRVGEPLSDARRALPGVRVRHSTDSNSLEPPAAAASPTLQAVIVSPAPAAGEDAAPDAVVEGVEFVMTPAVANRLRQQIATVFRGSGSRACAIRSAESVDSIVVWDLDIRGGALLTFPERQPTGATPTSRLFVYSGAWSPREGLAGYRTAACHQPA